MGPRICLDSGEKKYFLLLPVVKHECFYSKTNQMPICHIYFILFSNNTLHVTGGLSVHHQESETVHTAPGIYRTGSVGCLLASRQQNLYDIRVYLMLYVQS